MNVQPLSDDEAAAAGLVGFCCCLLALVGVGVLIFFLVRRSSAPAGRGPGAPPPGIQQPLGGAMLSVLAVGLDASVRQSLELQLAAPLASVGPVQARVELVQRVVRLLQASSGAWRYFGYGEKGLGDLVTAEQSYRLALDDFRGRSALAGVAGGTLCVVTLVLATRGALPGVSRLDDSSQLRELLSSRALVDAAQLLGAETVWAPASGGMSDDMLLQRFPEMHRLVA